MAEITGGDPYPLPFEAFGVLVIENFVTDAAGVVHIGTIAEFGRDLETTVSLIVHATPERPLVLRKRGRRDDESGWSEVPTDTIVGGPLDISCHAPDGVTIRLLDRKRAEFEAYEVGEAELALRVLGFRLVSEARASIDPSVRLAVRSLDDSVRYAEEEYLKERWRLHFGR